MPLITTYQKRSTPYWLNYIYSGQFFNWNQNNTLGAGGSLFVIIKTSDIGRIFHLLSIDVTSNSTDMFIYIYENCTYTGGTLDTVINSDLRSSKTPDTQILINPGMSTYPTTIFRKYAVTRAGGYNYSGIYTTGLYEMVFKKNTTYALRVYSATLCFFTINLNFYESGN